MDGFLLVDKPAGISSFGVVAKVRRIISEAEGKGVKIGHCGTLDPFATGLLILVIGKYTKKAGDFSKLDKTYEAELTLGKSSSSDDPEGDIVQKSTQRPDETEVRMVLSKFIGNIQQTPPAFSAIKVAGRRAYALARAGKPVNLEPRQVIVNRLEVIDYEYPKLRVLTEVSSGTYIRSLAVDIGAELGIAAYLSALRRTKIADYLVDDAVQLENLTYKIIQANLQKLAKCGNIHLLTQNKNDRIVN